MARRAHHPKMSFAFSTFTWFNQISRKQRPAERLPPYGAGNVSPGILTITARHSLLSASYSSPPTACLAVSLPKGRRDWVTTFLTVDPLDDLGVPFTPVVQQFRAGSYETCILTTRCSHKGAASCLLILVGTSLIDDAYRHLINFTIPSVPSP